MWRGNWGRKADRQKKDAMNEREGKRGKRESGESGGK